MSFEEPTYEEYKRAGIFARIRYKYGIFITAACWICLMFIIYYMVSHAEELASDPMHYALRKQPKLECHCYRIDQLENDMIRVDFYINGSHKWLEEDIELESFTPESLEKLEELFEESK